MLPRSYYTDQEVRKRQIDTLKIFNERVVEISENTEYKVEFSAEGKSMSLNVLLSPEFPNEKPTIFINPVIAHPWIAENTNQVFILL
jgi:ESCRT-I complex subunit VPS37